MTKKRAAAPTVEKRVRDFAITQMENAFSFNELLGHCDLDLDDLARALLERDRIAGANVQHVDPDEDAVLRNALPEALQPCFRDYVDSIEGLGLYTAEVGYMLGLEIGKRLAGGGR